MPRSDSPPHSSSPQRNGSPGSVPAPALEVTALTKSYGELTVLDRLDLTIPAGSVFCLLGPNGAGKTTTVRILSTLINADSGQARVAGFDVRTERRQVRRRISLTGQFAAIDEVQTGVENLRMIGALAHLGRSEARRRADELLDQFDLVEAGGRRVATYSGGMRRRLDLAASLVSTPEVIFLDEPTTGLDPRSRQQLWQVISDLAGTGVTVFLTTQTLDEADRLADRIAILDNGRLVAEGTAAELKRRVAEQRLELTLTDRPAFDGLARRLTGQTTGVDPARLIITLPTDGNAGRIRTLFDELDPGRTLIQRFAIHDATLDDVFLALTGHTGATPSKETADV